MNQSNTLRKAQDRFQNALLDPAVRTQSEAWSNIYYSSSTLKAFQARFAKFQETDPTQAAKVVCLFEDVATAWNDYAAARLVEKARKADKRAAVAAKRDLKAELNLQEGISLKGVDVGPYKVILAGLEPVRLHVYAAQKAALNTDRVNVAAELGERDFKFPRHAVYPAGTTNFRPFNLKHDANRKRFSKWFDLSDENHARLRDDNAERIQKSAEQFALAYVQGYAAKLAIKAGEVVANEFADWTSVSVGSARVSSDNLWSDSVAELDIYGSDEDGEDQQSMIRFHTQIIWNRSCLGKVFNQYPTRRVDTAR